MSLLRKNKWLTIFLAALVLGILGLVLTMSYIYKPHEEIDDMEALFTGSVEAFQVEITKDPLEWNGKVVELTGDITSLDEAGVMVGGVAYCQPKDSVQFLTLTEGTALRVKGRFIGYDDLLEEVKLDNCVQIGD